MNFHSYGDLWIFPFNYYKGNDKDVLPPLVYEFYQNYSKDLDRLGFKSHGNAESTIQYIANGEASDWMLGEHNIISMSPELGTTDSFSQTFFPEKEHISYIVNNNYKAIDLFLKKTIRIGNV